jgi:1-acyl-sn-glycerol-3-phosphate acyltransferase
MDTLRTILTWLYGILFIVLMFPVTCLIWVLTYPFDNERRAIHRWLLFQGSFLTLTSPIWTTTIEGRYKIAKGETYVIISNHQSIIDILLINMLGNNFRWVSKSENFRVPILGATMRLAKYIEIERGNKESVIQMMEKATEALGKGISVMMFPEGTRSRADEPGLFKTGAFQLALQTGRPILPVIIDGTGKVLPKKGLMFRGGHRLKLKVLDPVYLKQMETIDPEVMAVEFRNMMVDELAKMRMSK